VPRSPRFFLLDLGPVLATLVGIGVATFASVGTAITVADEPAFSAKVLTPPAKQDVDDARSAGVK
jgi:hypothetical protein